MKIEKTFTDDHQVKLTVEFEAEPMEGFKRRAARELAKRAKIPGFRPGKAPYNIIERTVGSAAIMDEAIDLLVHDMYPKILDEAEVKPYGPGSLTNITQIDPPVLEFQVPLEPSVKLGNYKAVRVPYELKPTDEQEVEDMLSNLRERYATYTKVERPAQEGDQVVVHLSSERTKPEEGQPVTLIRDRETPVTIDPADKDNKGEWPFPGFSRHLLGLSAGDEKSIEYTYAEDSVLESLRGTEAIFRVKVDSVNLPGMPELDDEFAKTLGEESLETLRAEIRKSIEERSKSEYDSDFHDKLMAEMLKDAVIKYPPQMLENEIDGMVEQLKNRMQQQGIDYPTYLKTRQLDDAGFREEIKPNAVERLQRSLVLLEVLRLEDIHVTEEELQAETMRTLNQLAEMVSPEELKRITQKDNVQNLVGNVSSDLLIQNAWKRLESIAKGEIAEAIEKAVKKPRKKKEAKDESTENTEKSAKAEKRVDAEKAVKKPRKKKEANGEGEASPD